MVTNNLPLFYKIAVRGCGVEALQQLSSTPDMVILEPLEVHWDPTGDKAQDVAIAFITT
ncbi:MAG: hypothetical protein NTAFB01_05490 [Nitrospira sp.]